MKKSSASAPVDRVREAAGSVRILELTQPVAESIRALSEIANLAPILTPLPSTETLLGPGSASPAGVQAASTPGTQHLAGTTLAAEDEGEATHVAPILLPPVRVELAPLSLSSEQARANGHPQSAVPLPVANGGYLGGGSIQNSGRRAPAEVPVPTPGSTQAATGFSATTFIPLVALLALLALAAPATGRRLREAPRFCAPLPFVCALERPG